jgi:ribokinase
VAVIGHVEWVTHARGRLPGRGEIAVLDDPFDEPAGGGAVSAVQAARLGAECLFYTAFGSDDAARRSEETLRALGLELAAARREASQRRALSVVEEGHHDRTIMVAGPPQWPTLDDPLPWDELGGCDAVYFTGDDPRTLVAARAAGRVVVTARRLKALVESRMRADVLVASASDPGETVAIEELPVRPGAVVFTEGERGGRYAVSGGGEHRFPAAPAPGPAVDAYGCGDSFAAGLTVGLARGLELVDAIALGARCGAACLTGRGGLAMQLRESG